MVSEHETRVCKIFKVTVIISGSLVFKAVLIGIMSYGITGKTFEPPASNISKTP